MNQISSEQKLTTLGVLPFLVFSLFSHDSADHTYNYYLSTYSLLILCFLAGSHWGLAQTKNSKNSFLLRSNFLTLICTFIACTSIYSIAALIFLFIYALYADKKLLEQEIISQDYFQMRQWATASVCLILLTHLFQA